LLFAKPKKAVGIDIGTHSIKAVQMSRFGGRLRLDAAGYAFVDRNQLNVDPIGTQANALREAIRLFTPEQSLVVGALPGQTVVIRYPRLPEMPEDQIASAIEKEAGQHIPYDLSEVFLDWTLLDTVTEGNNKLFKVLLVAAKHEVIDTRVQIAGAADVQYGMLTVDSLALADAAESCDFLRVGETVALVNIGLSSSSIHFVRDGISSFIRDVNWGARELIQAIARARRVDYEQAEKLLATIVDEESEKSESETATVEDEEQLPEIQVESSESSARGASLLDPFEDELDSVSPPPKQKAGPILGTDSGEKDLQEIIAAPLGRFVSEIRRSFDYYEHELYENAIDRLILSGGVAHISVLSEVLSDELGLKSVEVANPVESALMLGDARTCAPLIAHPAQFMVAVGLAARGMAEI
jgi:type IV pilus assembly protein PilM